MKKRELLILEDILNTKKKTTKELISKFSISRRTLYYDIEAINYNIKRFGQLVNVEGSFEYIGDLQNLHNFITQDDFSQTNDKDKINIIILKILLNQKFTITSLSEEFRLSKNSIVQLMEKLKSNLLQFSLKLENKPNYKICGNELDKINLYITVVQELVKDLTKINPIIHQLDEDCNLNLTDFSLVDVSLLYKILKTQNELTPLVNILNYQELVEKINYFPNVLKVLDNKYYEAIVLTAYIASCSSLNLKTNVSKIDVYADKLIERFIANSAIEIKDTEELKNNIKQHLLSSYYRIIFRFPISNPSLQEIKIKYSSLFKIIKAIIENPNDFPDFIGIREEEIAFITLYFGGYLRSMENYSQDKNRVLIVCPNGLMISTNLKRQIKTILPSVEIVGTCSIKQLNTAPPEYDYIISTVALPQENVIVVNPVLNKFDVEILLQTFAKVTGVGLFDVESIIKVVRKHAIINDENLLKKDLFILSNHIKEKENNIPMLKELLTKERIKRVKNVKDWQEAITIASHPLIEDGSIEESYITEMIKSVQEHGPYIVIADRFALPHASLGSGVNKLSMALLALDEEVDLLGKPVNILVVLATVDKTSHMKALASLSELLYDKENLEKIRTQSTTEILNLIEENEKEVN